MKQSQTLAIESLSFKQTRTYIFSTLFIIGNVVLPQLCHLVPMGGLRLLPIYFFTLIAAYRYGIAAGLLTAILSPVVNNLIFGMPPTNMLPVILIKSVTLACTASIIASKVGKNSIIALSITVVLYQILGSMAEWGITGSLTAALQDIRIGWIGILLQIFGGYVVISIINKRVCQNRHALFL